MWENVNPKYWNAKLLNFVVGLLGVVLILVGVLIGMEQTISVILVSIGTSMLASAIVSGLSSRYLVNQSRTTVMVV